MLAEFAMICTIACGTEITCTLEMTDTSLRGFCQAIVFAISSVNFFRLNELETMVDTLQNFHSVNFFTLAALFDFEFQPPPSTLCDLAFSTQDLQTNLSTWIKIDHIYLAS